MCFGPLFYTPIKLQKNAFNSYNTVVSNHFHSIKILLFSSARSRDFDGTPGTELPVSMYTIKTHNRYVPF